MTITPTALLDPWAVPLELDLNTRHERACGCGEQWYAHGDAHLAARLCAPVTEMWRTRKQYRIGTRVHGRWHYTQTEAERARPSALRQPAHPIRKKRRNV